MRSKADALKCPHPLIFILTLILFPASTFSATIHVPTDQPTIQAGIDAASTGDIVLVADGTYTGEGNKNIDFKGKAITVQSENGPETTIIDCEGNGRGFYIHSGEQQDSVVSGFTVKNGKGQEGPDFLYHGGGIYCENSSPTIDNCIITENSSYYGNGISIWGGAPTISNCTITGNYLIFTSGNGGGIFCHETSALITNCTITGNQAGGIFCRGGSPTVTKCTITGNSTTGTPSYGGGISSENSSILISDCLIKNNSAGHGGGISFRGGSPTIIRSSIVDNNSTQVISGGGGGGGGIYCGSDLYFNPANSIITNCFINGNTAGHGGGISSAVGSTTIINSTISGNSASQSSSGAVYGNPSTNIINSILWSNYPNEIYPNSSPIVKYSTIEGSWDGIGNIDLNPVFVDPANGDYRLKNHSPSIGAGTPMGAPNTDIEGNPRPNPVGSSPDMGAYENSRSIRAIPPLNVFGVDVGNRWNYEGTQQGSPYTVEREVLRLDQTTFPVDTYVYEIIENGNLLGHEWYEKTTNELRLWASGGYQFSAGLLAAWYPMQMGDHRESSVNVVGFPGVSVSLTVDVISKGPLALTFDTLEAYELHYQLQTSGPGGTAIDTFRWWLVPYIGVVRDQDADSVVELTSFAIGGNTLDEDADADSDGLKDYQELIIYGTSMVDADTDSDGMPDGWEATYGLDPLDDNDANGDIDQDGYTNLEEYQRGTDPSDPNSYPSKAMPWIPLLLL